MAADEAPAAGAGFEERWWRSRDGLRLFARDYAGAGGEARLPVVCLHGLTRNSRDFEEVAPAIAAHGRRVLAIDVRGRGRSDRDPNPSNYVPNTYATDVLELLDALGIARAVFVGTSMGGIITMAIAARRARTVAGVVFNDVGPEISPEGVARIAAYVGRGDKIEDWSAAADYMRSINALAFPDYAEADWDRFARRTFREGPDGPELDYDPRILEPLQAGKYKAAQLLAWILFRRVARRRPTLLIRGELSDLLTAGIADRMKRHAPKLQVATVPGVGHAPMLTEQVAAEALAAFLDSIA